MARYLIVSRHVDKSRGFRVVRASEEQPRIIVLGDSEPASATWWPLDAAAKAQLAAQGVDRAIPVVPSPHEKRSRPEQRCLRLALGQPEVDLRG